MSAGRLRAALINGHRLKAAYEQGDTDTYYSRRCGPRIILDMAQGWKIEVHGREMTRAEIDAYWRGCRENPSDRKDWGTDCE